MDSVEVTVDCVVLDAAGISLTGEPVPLGNSLTWTLETELEASWFELERSADGSALQPFIRR